VRYAKIGLFGCLLALSTAAAADLSRVEALLEAIASGDENLAQSNLETFDRQIDEATIRNATPEQIQPLLAAARQCLRSAKRPIRVIGVGSSWMSS